MPVFMPSRISGGSAERRNKVIEIRVFKAENNSHNKSYYAVIGAKCWDEAIKAVIKKKKESSKTYYDYRACNAVIAPYKDGLDGLWNERDRKSGKLCVMVWKVSEL